MSTTTNISVDVLEGGTLVISASFQDEQEASVVPNTLNYTLLDDYGQIVNSLDKVTVTPSSSIEVTLSGNNLPAGVLYFLLKGTYDSTAGTGLPLKGYAKIDKIKNEPGA